MTTHSIELIAFDMGGVLSFYDEDIAVREFARLSGSSERQVHEAVYTVEKKRPLETGQQTMSEFVSQVNRDLGLELSDDEFRAIYDSPHYAPNESLFEITEKLGERYLVGVCSNTGPTHWKFQKNRLPYFDRFSPVILSCDVGSMKPDRKIFDELSRLSGIALENTLFIDDHIDNVDSARSLGMKAVLYTEVANLVSELNEHGIVI